MEIPYIRRDNQGERVDVMLFFNADQPEKILRTMSVDGKRRKIFFYSAYKEAFNGVLEEELSYFEFLNELYQKAKSNGEEESSENATETVAYIRFDEKGFQVDVELTFEGTKVVCIKKKPSAYYSHDPIEVKLHDDDQKFSKELQEELDYFKWMYRSYVLLKAYHDANTSN